MALYVGIADLSLVSFNIRLFFCRIKDKINHPPERQDHQEVSNKLADFIRIKNEAKAGQVKKVRDGEDRPGKTAC